MTDDTLLNLDRKHPSRIKTGNLEDSPKPVPVSTNSFYENTNVQYFTGLVFNNVWTAAGCELLEADIFQRFDFPFIPNPLDTICAVERMEISLDTIPYVDFSVDNASYLLIDRSFVQHAITLTGQYYTLQELLDAMNLLMFESVQQKINDNVLPNTTPAGYSPTWYINHNGKIVLGVTSPADYDFWDANVVGSVAGIEMDDSLAQVLGICSADFGNDASLTTLTLTNYTLIQSRYGPRFDSGDQLDHIRIASDLGLESDQLGQSKTNIVTDVAIPRGVQLSLQAPMNTALSNVVSGINYSAPALYLNVSSTYFPRQNLIYEPGIKRWLNFASPAPLYDIHIWAEAVFKDGTSSKINLGPGSVFSIKLGFYQRTTSDS